MDSRVCDYPPKDISLPSSENDALQPIPASKPVRTSSGVRNKEKPNVTVSDNLNELRVAIDLLETRLAVVERRSKKSKTKVNCVVEALKRNGTFPSGSM